MDASEAHQVIDLRQAVNSAFEYIQSLRQYLGERLEDIRLEEVALSEANQNWLITLGFTVPSVKPLDPAAQHRARMLSAVNGPEAERLERQYKLLEIDAATGKVQSMRIRQV